MNTLSPKPVSSSGRALLTAAVCLLLSAAAFAQQAPARTITPNYKEADIRQIVEAVGAVTNR
ncbi:MAG TPA: hypothetical protein VE175_03980, partial [Woeseiaceae bacterium]|nr:hypothetical protein [Woeseiaceae bacterium]